MKRTVPRLSSNSRLEESLDMDPFSTAIIDQLLDSKEWSEQDEITKLTFTAFKDFINIYSNEIKELKGLLTTRASKQELSVGLALKANVSDLTKIIEEISNSLDTKINYNDLNTMLLEYARKKELNQVLMISSSRIENEAHKGRKTDRELEMKVMEARFDDFQKEICKRVGSCVTLPQFQELIKIVEQKVNVSEMNEVLENRVTKQYLSTCLQKKVSKSDLEGVLSKKADTSDLELIINSLQMKASLPTIQKLTQIIENKADRSDIIIMANERKNMHQEHAEKLNMVKGQLEARIHELQKQIQNSRGLINEEMKLIEKDNLAHLRNFITGNEMTVIVGQLKGQLGQQFSKLRHDVDEISKSLSTSSHYDIMKRQLTSELNLRKRCEEKIYEEMDELRKKVEEVAVKKLEKTEYFNFKSELAEELDNKIETEHIQEAFNKWEAEIAQRSEADKEQIYQLVRRVQQTLTDSIAQNSRDIGQLMAAPLPTKPDKLDQPAAEEIVRKNRKDMDEFRKTVDAVYSELRSKLNVSEYQSDLLEIRKKFDYVDRQISLKANIKDVCILADSKPNIQDVNKALKEVKTVMDTKTCDSDLQEVVKDQATINQTLLCQNIIGRWLWQSGEVRAGGLVPWESQYANTVPDYYFWEKDKTSILVLVAGIYQITCCVFGRNAIPNIVINGDPILAKDTENNNNSNILKKAVSRRRKEKETIGNKVSEYVMLPPRSRISVLVPAEGFEGFLNIRRL